MPVVIRLAPVEFGEQKCVGLVMQRDGVDNAALLRRDPLTGLADRTQLLARLSELMGGERSSDQRFSVLFIDLDEFKKVNDIHGHMVGDKVLSEVAHRLSRCIRNSDLIVRYGGDEFVMLIEQADGWETFEPVIARIHAALSDPIWVGTEPLTISASVGGAELTDAHRKPEDLLAAADRAMYAAKRRGRCVAVAR